MDCAYLCNLKEALKWNDEALKQEYIEILASPCHYVKHIVMNITEEASHLTSDKVTTIMTITDSTSSSSRLPEVTNGSSSFKAGGSPERPWQTTAPDLSLKAVLVIAGVFSVVVFLLCGVIVVCKRRGSWKWAYRRIHPSNENSK